VSNIGRFTNLEESDLRLPDGRSWRRGLPAKNRKDWKGKRFGKLEVIAYSHTELKNGRSRSIWKTICDCGTFVFVSGNQLQQHGTTSCGCFKRTRKGLSNTRTYRSWAGMIKRCTDKKRLSYKSYGGRGIQVCWRWLDYDLFLLDMGERPERMTLDRIDPNKGYEPGNCRWATHEVQCNNKRNSHYITAHGETKTMAQWARQNGLYTGTIWARIQTGFSPEECVQSGKLPRRRLSC
jgi:hypothetical protein